MKTIGIIGNGKFGKLLSRIMPEIFPESKIKVFSRKEEIDSKSFFSFDDVVKSDLIIPAVPIRQFEAIIKMISGKIKENVIVMDVSSVKEFPVKVMTENLPGTVTIVATHPLFGPGTVEKLKGNLKDLKIIMHFERGDINLFETIKQGFISHSFKVTEMTPKDHDILISRSQFISHVVANILYTLEFHKTGSDTKTSEILHEFIQMIQPDKALLKDMFDYNPYTKSEFKKFEDSFNEISSKIQS